MKRHLLWTFDRGSFQWDIVCLLILAFLFLVPRNVFEDIPEFMKVSATEPVRWTVDKRSGSTIFTAKLAEPTFFNTKDAQRVAVGVVEKSLGKPVRVSRFEPIRDWTGRVIAYAVWKEK